MKVHPELLSKLKWLMILCFVGAVAMTVITAFEYLELEKLKNEGIVTEGTFHSERTLDTGKGRTSFKVIIDYKPEGHPTYRKVFTVPESLYNQVIKEKKIRVTYLKEKPEVSALGDNLKYDFEKLAVGGGLLVVGVAIWIYFRRLHSKIEKAVGLDGAEGSRS